MQPLVGLGQHGVAAADLGVVHPSGARHVTVGEIHRIQLHPFAHALVPAQTYVGGIPDFLHRRQAQFLEADQGVGHAALLAQCFPQRDSVLHRQAGAGADGEMRGAQGVAHEHHLVEAPALVPDRGVVAPAGVVGKDGMTAQVLGEDLLAMADGVLRAHVLETGPLPGLRLHFDQEGAHARAVAVVVRTEDAVPGLAKGQGEAVENPGSPVPDEFVGRRSLRVPKRCAFCSRTQE